MTNTLFTTYSCTLLSASYLLILSQYNDHHQRNISPSLKSISLLTTAVHCGGLRTPASDGLSYSTSAIARAGHTGAGPGQTQATQIHDRVARLAILGRPVEIRWAKGHSGVPGNEKADTDAVPGLHIYQEVFRSYENAPQNMNSVALANRGRIAFFIFSVAKHQSLYLHGL